MHAEKNLGAAFLALLLGSLACAAAGAAETSPFGDLLRAQEERLALDDQQRLEEEDVLRAKRSPAENAMINAAVDQFYDAAGRFDYAVMMDDDIVLDRLSQIEGIKQSILDVREISDDTEEIEAMLKAELSQAYETLESASYITTSLEGPLVLRGSSFNARRNAWTLSVTSSLLGYTTLFAQDLRVSYQELTKSAYGPDTGMTKEQAQAYNDTVLVYDSFFRQAIPLVYVRLTYTVQRWKRASEYRFVPVRCELFRSDTNRLVKVYEQQELEPSLFVMYPQLEVRSKEERLAEQADAEAVLDQEREDAKKGKAATGSIAEDSIQQGRRGIFLTADTAFTEDAIAGFDIRNVTLNSVRINGCLGILRHGFFGGSISYDNTGSDEGASYGFGLDGGLNFRLGEFIRPYAEIGAEFHTDKSLVGKVGAGVDVTIGKLLLVVGYDLRGVLDLNNMIAGDSLTVKDIVRDHDFFIGFGITW